MGTNIPTAADTTAERAALWRALHVQIDPEPHVLEDELGLRLAEPHDDWRGRPDMNPELTKRSRASIVVRARYIEDVLAEQEAKGVHQYVILGAGLDTFAQRNTDLAAKLQIFEVDKPAAQVWKQHRLKEIGYPISEQLHFVPVDFEAGQSWWENLTAAGFDPNKPAVVTSTGVSVYLSKEAVAAMLKQVAMIAPDSTFIMTYMLPFEMIEPEERAALHETERNARESGTPFLSFFPPDDILTMARDAGFRYVKHVSAAKLTQKYFFGRTDGLYPSAAEEFLVARM